MTDALKSLVIMIVILAVFGISVGGAWYYAVELPRQTASTPPTNTDNPCMDKCLAENHPHKYCADRCIVNPVGGS
jgi:hypothetical protein